MSGKVINVDFSENAKKKTETGRGLVNSKTLSSIISVPVWSIQKMTREKKIPAYSLNGRTFLYDVDEVIDNIKKRKI